MLVSTRIRHHSSSLLVKARQLGKLLRSAEHSGLLGQLHSLYASHTNEAKRRCQRECVAPIAGTCAEDGGASIER